MEDSKKIQCLNSDLQMLLPRLTWVIKMYIKFTIVGLITRRSQVQILLPQFFMFNFSNYSAAIIPRGVLAYLCQNPETYKQKCHHRR